MFRYILKFFSKLFIISLEGLKFLSVEVTRFKSTFIFILETNSLSFKINSISSGITLKKGSSVISASTTVGYLTTDNFELTAGTVIGNEIIKFYVTGKENIICTISITIRSGCDVSCNTCDENGDCISCNTGYYQKDGESPVICYLQNTQIEGYYYDSTQEKFKYKSYHLLSNLYSYFFHLLY